MTTILKQVAAGFMLACLFTLTVIAVLLTMTMEDRLSTRSYAPTFTEQTITCTPPESWIAITPFPEDSMLSIASRIGLSEEALRKANCLARNLQPGERIYIPPSPRGETPLSCGPPPGWRLYTVKETIRLDDLAKHFDLTAERLQEANCFPTSIVLYEGQSLFVPFPIVVTPAPTISPSEATSQENGSRQDVTPSASIQP